MAYTKVALAGATGNLGPSILDQLLKAGFTVTVLTRIGSTHSFSPSVTVAHVDYDSLDSLTDALRGQDAVVSTLSASGLAKPVLLVEAAVKAGVKRFIPSEFGSNTAVEKTRSLPCFKDKVAVQDALQKAAANSALTYTAVVNGPFLDWGISYGFIANLKGKSVNLYDGGDRLWSTTTLPSIGKAVAGVLKHPEETKNRFVYVQSAAVSMKKLAALGKKAVGADGWTEEAVSTSVVLDEAWAEMKKPEPNPQVFVYGFLKACIWGEGYGSYFDKLDNDLLGVPQLTDVELEELVKSLAK